MTIATQFPDFDLTTLPAIPADWQDTSWHNDLCPSFTVPRVTGFACMVYVDFADMALREIEDGKRFVVVAMRTDDSETLLESDDWQAVLDFVATL